MRRRAAAAWILLALGVALSATGNALSSTALQAPAMLLVTTAAGLALSLLPFWRTSIPPLPPMRDLMLRPRPSQRWCTGCGRPAPRNGTCPSCGKESRRQRRERRRLDRKQRRRLQEKKT